MTETSKNQTSELDLDLFRSPTAEYRGAPFWAWNCRLDRERLMRQIAVFKAMGLGGFHIHARTGLVTPYLSDEFMELVRACVERAEQEGLRAWLYDEDRYPSGFAGGLVTREPRFRARQLLFTRFPYDSVGGDSIRAVGAFGQRAGNGTLLARYQVVLRDGLLANYRQLAESEEAPANGAVWYAYAETMLPTPWYNNQAYVDTLNKAAIERFVAVTHERYAEVVGSHFGHTIPAIFTDEPQLIHKQCLGYPEELRDLVMPWTDDLYESYHATYGDSLEDQLPELFWELPDGRTSAARYRYHDHVCERFARAFVDTVGGWCVAHGLALTGHLMDEPTLGSQTRALGEAMRLYRGFELPGIDILCDFREYTTAKQAQSAARQHGWPGVLSELYGVTNWDFDFAGHKAQGDWQAALGVTVRVHHLTWLSMAGEAKRDYPASIGEQSPWWREYRLVEDHFARLNTALTRGKPLVQVGVIHPIESYWLCFGPLHQTAVDREERERAFTDLTNWLLFGLIDFDFIAESLLPELCPLEPTTDERRATSDDQQPAQLHRPSSMVHRPDQETESSMQVGAMRYNAVIVPGLRTIRATTLERLERFSDAGGIVIFAGEIPSLVDAEPSERARVLAVRCRQVAFARGRILEALEPFRKVGVWLNDSRPADTILHQIRVDGDRRYVFFYNTAKERSHARARIAIEGAWHATLLDTLDGATCPLDSRLEGERTWIDWDFPAHGSLLLVLSPYDPVPSPVATREGVEAAWASAAMETWIERARLTDPVPVTLSEPNVLLLDQAAYQLNDEGWQPMEEILRIDTLLRRRLGFPLRTEDMAAPCPQISAPPPTNTVTLKFVVHAEIDVAEPALALEDAELTEIHLDGQLVSCDVTGWFVDEAIKTIRLPRLAPGSHEIVLTRPFGPLSNLEWCYLLGDFGVDVHGRHARIVAPVRQLAFGDWTHQGLPFYAGNITYHCTLEGDGATLAIRAPKFKALLLSIALDGEEIGKIAFAPFQITLGMLARGKHALDITAYGNRVNAFGAIHNANERTIWFGPMAWRTKGDE